MKRRPLIVVVDDDPAVLGVLARDLRREFGTAWSVVLGGSGAEAMELTRQARLRDEAVALFLVDERMPGMSGVEFLREARTFFPDAGRVLLTAYTDGEAAIRAINEARVDHYLVKPWDPPEERLFPVLRDLLESWAATPHPWAGQLRVVDLPGSAEGHRLRGFLLRNLVPHRWMDALHDAEAGELLKLAGIDADDPELPLLFFPDGAYALRPSLAEVARHIGLRTRPGTASYDVVIVGAGPAGLTAAIHAASEGLSTLVVERDAPGGQAGHSARIENYLGFPSGLSGSDLAWRGTTQARRFGAEILTPVEACRLEVDGEYRILHLSDGSRVACRALLVATGVATTLLEVPGASHLSGRGVHYSAGVIEALAVQGKDVAVVGGGNSAGQAALHLARFARTVTLLVRKPTLASSMSRYLVTRIEEAKNIHLRTSVRLEGLRGTECLQGITLRPDDPGGPEEEMDLAALFVFIGAEARTDWLADTLLRDPQGFLLTGPDLHPPPNGRLDPTWRPDPTWLPDLASPPRMASRSASVRPPGWWAPRDPFWLEASVPGVFVAGDVRHRSVKRVASAVGEGAMAIQFIHRHLQQSHPGASQGPAWEVPGNSSRAASLR